MTKSQKRDIATSLTSLIFIVIGGTGVLMYFHLFDSYTKELHEIIGLFFVAVVFLHVFFNWNSMRTYFSKKVFLISLLIVSIFSLSFILSPKPEGGDPKKNIIGSVLNASLDKSLAILGLDIDEANIKLEAMGIKINDAKSINDIAKANKKSPFEIVGIISK